MQPARSSQVSRHLAWDDLRLCNQPPQRPQSKYLRGARSLGKGHAKSEHEFVMPLGAMTGFNCVQESALGVPAWRYTVALRILLCFAGHLSFNKI